MKKIFLIFSVFALSTFSVSYTQSLPDGNYKDYCTGCKVNQNNILSCISCKGNFNNLTKNPTIQLYYPYTHHITTDSSGNLVHQKSASVEIVKKRRRY